MIKPNIDLTENEIFSKPILGRALPTNLFRLVGTTFPWTVYFHKAENDDDLSTAFQPFLTGNKQERELKKLLLPENLGNYCDCCGAYLCEIPWDRTYGLCRECHKYMEEKYGSKKDMPWQKSKRIHIIRDNPLLW